MFVNVITCGLYLVALKIGTDITLFVIFELLLFFKHFMSKNFFYIILICVFLLITSASIIYLYSAQVPQENIKRSDFDDRDLEYIFDTHEEDFNSLISMFKEDTQLELVDSKNTRLSTVNNSTGMPTNGITDVRLNAYRALFQKIGLQYGMSRTNIPNTIAIGTYASGFVTNGIYKGYMYSPNNLEPLYDNLDNVNYSEIPTDTFIFKKMRDSWYLYFIYYD